MKNKERIDHKKLVHYTSQICKVLPLSSFVACFLELLTTGARTDAKKLKIVVCVFTGYGVPVK